jgi:hypothetical protein
MKKENEKVYMYILGAVIVLGFYIIIAFVFQRPIPETNNDVAMLLIGALIAKFADVVGYFYGSSKGSADKTNILNSQKE